MARNWKHLILTDLLSTFERRDVARTGVFANAIAINVLKKSDFKAIDTVEEKNLFMSDVLELKNDGVVDFRWEMGEEGNIIERITLVPDMDKVDRAYEILGRIPPYREAEAFLSLLDGILPDFPENSDIKAFLFDMRQQAEDKKRIPRFFTSDGVLTLEILDCLHMLAWNREEVLPRVMSKDLYKDSKEFEKHVKPKVCSILRAINGDSEIRDDELLEERGIVSNPEVLAFRGMIAVETEDGLIDYSNEVHGAYINTRTVKDVVSIKGEGIRHVLFIENLANYTDYIETHEDPTELVIYHGGCYSPMKGLWFTKLYEALSSCGCSDFQHWSDIDYGGFNIFVRLQSNIIPVLRPYKMDVDTLVKYGDKAEPLTAEYRKLLEKLLDDERFTLFHQVIRYMLLNDVRLEQESIIIA